MAKAKKTARKAQKQNSPASLLSQTVGYAGGYKPTAAERKAIDADRRRYERETRRNTAISTVAQIHMGSGKPAAQILREADAVFAWLNAGYGK